MLVDLGLSMDEAVLYEALLKYGPSSAGELSKRTKKIKRGLVYKLLDKLVEKGLVLGERLKTKTTFIPKSPDVLLEMAEKNRSLSQKAYESITQELPTLQAKYAMSMQRPIIRFFEGAEKLKELYNDRLKPGTKTQYLVRASGATVYEKLFGKWFTDYLKQQSSVLTTNAITPDGLEAIHNPAIDKARRVTRTWLRPEYYKAHAEIASYGNKVAVVSYGKELFGVIIENAVIAQAVQELFKLAEMGAKTMPVHHDHK